MLERAFINAFISKQIIDIQILIYAKAPSTLQGRDVLLLHSYTYLRWLSPSEHKHKQRCGCGSMCSGGTAELCPVHTYQFQVGLYSTWLSLASTVANPPTMATLLFSSMRGSTSMRTRAGEIIPLALSVEIAYISFHSDSIKGIQSGRVLHFHPL